MKYVIFREVDEKFFNAETGTWVPNIKGATEWAPYNPLRFYYIRKFRNSHPRVVFKRVIYLETKMSLSQRLYFFLTKLLDK